MSKTHFIGIMAVLAVVMVLMTGCGANTVTIARQFQEAVNSQNVDSALKLLAEDASLQLDEFSTVTGKDQVADWLATQAELHYQFNGDPIAVDSAATFENCSISSNQWVFYGINPMSGTCEVALVNGLITRIAVQFDESSKAKLSGSPVAATADMIGVWTTKNYMTDSGNLYLQFYEDGSARLVGTQDDYLDDPDSDQPGARLMWTYEDYMLSIRNVGPASEGYCQEQDIGKYLVKKADGGGLRFNTISDPCSLRGLAFNLPPRWRPNAP